MGTCLGVSQRVLFECCLAFLGPKNAKKSTEKALKKHSLGHSEAGAQNCSKTTPWGTFRPRPRSTPVNGGRDLNSLTICRFLLCAPRYTCCREITWHISCLCHVLLRSCFVLENRTENILLWELLSREGEVVSNPYSGSMMQRLCDQIWKEELFEIKTLQVPICMNQWQSMLAPASAAISASGGKKNQT